MTLEIYSKITKENNNYGLSETIQTEINTLAIIPILSDSIYKDPISSFRELYANEITACKLSKLDCRIEINLNTETRVLTIQGFNSMGITKEVFHKILKVMGNSGNNNGKNSGQFGLGFFSHVKLSEKMIIHSYAQNKECFSFISKSGLSFEVLPDEFTEKLNQYGTKLILTVKDSIDLDSLIQKIKDCIEFSIIKTDFILDNVNQLIKQYSSLKEFAKDKLQINKKRYSSKSFKIYQSSNEFYDLIIVKQYPTTWKNTKCNASLLNVPIYLNLHLLLESDYVTDSASYCEFFINIKDEKLFEPHVSRDYFTIESENKLKKLIRNDFNIFSNYDPIRPEKINFNDYINDNDRFFKYSFSPYVKTIFETKKRRFIDGFIKYLDYIDENYIIKGICFVKTYNIGIMKQLFHNGYLPFFVSKEYERFFEDCEDLLDVKTILDEIGIKNRYGQIRKINKVYSWRKQNRISYIFKLKDPQIINQFSHYDCLGFTSLESKNKKHYDISYIKELLQDDFFFTNQGYKKLDELKDYKLNYVEYIIPSIIPESNDLIAYIDHELSIQLISVYYNFKTFSHIDLIKQFIRNYVIKNDIVKNLIKNNIINPDFIYNKDQLDLFLNLDNYDN